jgi:hypothetical protein
MLANEFAKEFKSFDDLPVGTHRWTIMFFSFFCLDATIVLLEKYNDELLLKSVEKYRINYMPLFPAIGHKLIKGE